MEKVVPGDFEERLNNSNRITTTSMTTDHSGIGLIRKTFIFMPPTSDPISKMQNNMEVKFPNRSKDFTEGSTHMAAER